MSFSNIRPYFKTKLEALGFKEFKEAFDFSNVANTIANKSFHVTLGEISNEGTKSQGMTLEVPVTLEFQIKGYKDTQKNYDDAVQLGQSIILSIMNVADRLSSFSNIDFKSMILEPVDQSNDNTILVTQVYNVRLVLCLQGG